MQRAAVCKELRPSVREIHLVILQHLPKGQKSAGTLQGWNADRWHFYRLPLPCWHWQAPFLPSHSNLLKAVCEHPCSSHSTKRRSSWAATHLHSTRTTPPKPTGIHSLHRGHPLSARPRLTGGLCFWTQVEREFKRQRRTRARLNNKVHFPHRAIPSRQGKIAASHDTQKHRQSSKMRKWRNTF